MWEWERYFQYGSPRKMLTHTQSGLIHTSKMGRSGGKLEVRVFKNFLWFDRSCWRKISPMTLSRLDREWRSRFWTSILPKAELVLNLWSCFEQEHWIHNFSRCKSCIDLLSFLNMFFCHSSPKHLELRLTHLPESYYNWAWTVMWIKLWNRSIVFDYCRLRQELFTL